MLETLEVLESTKSIEAFKNVIDLNSKPRGFDVVIRVSH